MRPALHQSKLSPVGARLVPLDELLQTARHFLPLQTTAPRDLLGDVFGDIARPALDRVEADYSHGVVVLTAKEVGDDGFRSVSSTLVSRQQRPIWPKSSRTRWTD